MAAAAGGRDGATAIARAIILVADGVGCGGAPDAAEYGDGGADTLGNLARQLGPLALPQLGALGLGHLTAIAGVPPTSSARGAYGAMIEASAGKDTITGHWEMAGLLTTRALPTFPHGFPPAILDPLRAAAGGRGILGNKPASGTAIIEELGAEHLRTGGLIVYTSADSVLQIAAHEEVIPLPELDRICTAARAIADRHRIGRVIARPFVGTPGQFRRTYNRRDYSLVPPGPTLCDAIVAAGMPVVGVGKISDIFAGRGVSESLHSEGNRDGLRLTLEALARLARGLLFVNLVDFDMLYGHRNDAVGFYRALRELDDWLPAFQAALAPGDVAFITADHGNDPTTPGTDHTRERVPLLAFGPSVRPGPLGTRASFCDLGQTIAAGLGLAPLARGISFLDQIAC
ncbi:MAG TPA: phosphopentomutase [Polyangia bacterium]|nr:phosphopentomutase [Polyangia bacterium]